MPSPPDTYFEKIDARLPGHGEDITRLKHDGILIDGEGVLDGKLTKVLLQIFSANAVGPIFFEFIQRKGDEGFGEGNFRALFVSIEEDQVRRGVLTPTAVTPLMNGLRVTDFRDRGFAAGLASHGIGTARAFEVDSMAAVFAGIAMSFNALLTSMFAPLAAAILIR